ncbi:hypothetical protein TRV_02467 [Trichophyton verrucosum HKI 0517]|uniref:Uncharacterized protein n=1 Tax=Trichophyton verrucosum (strain HKI 0517) TaxID=663202 RepID=D4D5U4_TRIVH|nr:uncharacterized protein TRV_02467 [Trichophyton verrucosum HKI 0517]EFE42747.1 hypothetical protein TRV_02467 [Trichophyton verrucosum HKI 0517]
MLSCCPAVLLLSILEFWARRHVLLIIAYDCDGIMSCSAFLCSNRSIRSRQSPQITLDLATQPLVYKRPFLSLFPPNFSSSLFPSVFLSQLLLLHLLPLCTLPFLSLSFSLFTQTRMGLWSLICTQRCISRVPVSGWVVTAVLEVDSITTPDLTRLGSQELPIVGSTPAFEMSLRGCLRPPV